ncbi:hypothetical protein SISSUDRAFT_1041333 [Sistotremastrum suecicum HHB10207 ss-3]|uniref:Uncharacterized protein n=1 Tax=Sistotremastrum suecicum HHB10207 ss-3 TaxID=1314776 RepID=A0A166HGW6_9AGAM|nr:hypothetical protein SISSUDRAFT_1041333 [Sistotremastrum suecicum HHB10207 ss-3]
MDLYEPSEVHQRITTLSSKSHNHQVSTPTLQKYLRIKARQFGIPVPKKAKENIALHVPCHLVLEPLYFGILPHTLIPTIFFMIPVIYIAIYHITPPILREFQALANKANAELAQKRKRKE